MPGWFLIVSDPPHAPEVDLERAAAVLGGTPADLRLRIAYPLPEVWLAAPTAEAAAQKGRALKEAGLNVLGAKSEHLARIPPAALATAVALEPGAVTFACERGPVRFDAASAALWLDVGVTVLPSGDRR